MFLVSAFFHLSYYFDPLFNYCIPLLQSDRLQSINEIGVRCRSATLC
jgi:hypothetical protein